MPGWEILWRATSIINGLRCDVESSPQIVNRRHGDQMSDVALEAHENGTVLPVQAQPKAKKNGLAGCHDGALKVQVTQAPENGKANDALEKVIAKSLGLKKSQVSLLSGATSTRKKFLIAGVSVADVESRIETAFKL